MLAVVAYDVGQSFAGHHRGTRKEKKGLTSALKNP